jgi:hypothetical protein
MSIVFLSAQKPHSLNEAFLCRLSFQMYSFQPFVDLFVKKNQIKDIFDLGWVAEIMQRPATSTTLT